jgi:hypothetical protein
VLTAPIELQCPVSWVPFTVAGVVTKSACTSETPQPTRIPPGSQIPSESRYASPSMNGWPVIASVSECN